MVLTRRASKCILRWLPNEVLGEVIQYLESKSSYRDLLALCRTSRLVHGLATPILYRSIRVHKPSAAHACFSTLRSHTSSRRAHLVRGLTLGDQESDDDCELSAHFIAEFTPIFQNLCHLQHLELFVVGQLTPLLHETHFPELVDLKSSVGESFSAALQSFINRHPTLVTLDLFRNNNFHLPEFGPVSLPHLTRYSGPACLVSGLVIANKCLDTLIVSLLANDPDVAPFAALGDSMVPTTPGSTKPTLGLISNSIAEHELLRYAAEGMSHIVVVEIITAVDGLSEESIRAVACTLSQFSGLRELCCIELFGFLWVRIDSRWILGSYVEPYI
ncbi:hypothetical protein DFH06DRAFT_753317 [Mycena polygramma]|nr:hypothetical protein DFH06DRAFT_753317 [Mycena polygramma]